MQNKTIKASFKKKDYLYDLEVDFLNIMKKKNHKRKKLIRLQKIKKILSAK